MLSTALSTGLLLLCGACVLACYLHLDQVRKIEHRLTSLRTLVSSTAAELDNLRMQVQKLRGQFFAFKQAVEDGPAEMFEEVSAKAPAGWDHGLPILCENYHRAQVDGPLSQAAKCDCAYCVEMRERRARARSELIPKTASAQAAKAKEASNRG